jgi:tetratricopeptide (TPR) repeat protein
MSKDDWYRNTKWNDQVESEFEARLKRSRGNSNKAQYLRIQASYLLDSQKPENQKKGIQLMERVIDDYPEETFSTIHGHEQLGDYYLKNGNFKEAERHFRIVTDHYHSNTRSGTTGLADLKLGETILLSDQEDKFQEAYELSTSKFNETGGDLLMNDQKFYYATLMANLCLRMGQIDEASEYANSALQLSTIAEPQFNRHKTVGIINADKNAIDRLKRIKEKSLATTTPISKRADSTKRNDNTFNKLWSRLTGK